MKNLILSFAILLTSFALRADVAEVMSCATVPDGVRKYYIKVSVTKEGSNFNINASAFNRTAKDVVETFINTKLDGCEFIYTLDAGKYFSCYKFDAKTGMKTFKISNVFVTENTLETLRYNLPRKSYRIEVAASSEDTSIDAGKFKEIIGNQNFMNLADCQ